MELKVFGGQASRDLSEKICRCMGVQLGKSEFSRFADGEIEVRYGENIRGTDVFIVQSTHPPADNLMELLLWIDAAKRAAANSITAVIPYYGWARQDRKARPRVPISAKLVANLIIRAGADQILTVDLHAAQLQGFFDIPVDHLYARPVFVDFFKGRVNIDNLIVMGPDAGAARLAESYAQRLSGRPVALAYKTRPAANKARLLHIVGDVNEKDILLVDDMVDTGGTLVNVAERLVQMGAKEVNAFCTHGVLSRGAVKKIEDSPLKKLFITDTIPRNIRSQKIQVISLAPLLAEAIQRSHNNQSISSLFE